MLNKVLLRLEGNPSQQALLSVESGKATTSEWKCRLMVGDPRLGLCEREKSLSHRQRERPGIQYVVLKIRATVPTLNNNILVSIVMMIGLVKAVVTLVEVEIIVMIMSDEDDGISVSQLLRMVKSDVHRETQTAGSQTLAQQPQVSSCLAVTVNRMPMSINKSHTIFDY